MDLPLHPDCRLLKSDPSGLLAVHKAEGVLSHPNPSPARAPAPSALLPLPYDPDLEAYLSPGNAPRWFLLNRLDAPTSGILLLSTDPDTARAVKAALACHSVRKTYAALVKGVPPRRKDTWRDFLKVTRRRGILRTAVHPGRPNAETAVELLERGKGPPARALVALSPVTGRTHQLRVQCASRRLPIIGDATYGDFSFNRTFRERTGLDRLYLHSWKIALEVPVGGRRVRFSAESPLPAAFAVALRQG
ncbi:MAG: RluA family pseudouridine synthase [Oceanipulchritudo sp.]